MTSVPVFVQGWQHECCGEPFAVGSRVAWRLAADEGAFFATALGEHAPRWSRTLPLVAWLDPTGSGQDGGAVLGSGDLRAFVHLDTEPATDPGGVLVRGPLLEDQHVGVPQAVSPTQGVVRRVRTVRVADERDAASGGRVPAPGSARLANVVETERWNSDEDGRRFIGFLVDLEVDG